MAKHRDGRVTRIAIAVALIGAIGAAIIALRARSDAKPRAQAAPAQLAGPAAPAARAEGAQLVEPPRDVRASDDPPGVLRLEGQVVTDTLDPVGGATVTITTVPQRTTKTESDGSFAFDGLLPRQYGLIAVAAEGVAGPVPARPTATRDPVIITLRPAAVVDVTVRRAKDRAPVAGAVVRAAGLVTITGRTDEAGRARLDVAPGRYDVTAGAPGLAPSRADVFLSAPGATREVELELVPGAAVSGRVLAGDQPVKDAAVVVLGDDGNELPDPVGGPVRSGADGAFALRAVPRGSFRIEARHDSYAPGDALVSSDGASARTGVVITLTAGAVVNGTVATKPGEPVAGALVRIAREDTAGPNRSARQAITDDAGRFRFTGLPAGKLLLAATDERSASAPMPIQLRAGQTQEVALVLERGGRVAGVVVDKAGQPVAGAMIRLWRDPRDQSPAPEAALWGFPIELSDEAGRFEVTGLAAGRYVLEAAPPGAMPRRRVSRRTWSAVADGPELRVVVEADGSVKGVVAYEDGTAPALFTVRAAGADTRGGGGDGAFEVRDIAPGTIAVSVEGPGFETKTVRDVTVRSGEPTDIDTIVVVRGGGRRITGRVVTPDGKPVAEAVVRAGRMLLGDGRSSNAAFARMAGATTRDTVTDDTGGFALYGVAKGDVALVAEHDAVGRSAAIALRVGDQSMTDIQLVLLPFGAIEGTLLVKGEPASKVIIQASPQASPEIVYGVATDAAGAFKFDQLAPDVYRVTALLGSPTSGFGQRHRMVTVQANQTATVMLEGQTGDVSLQVNLAARAGGAPGMVFVIAVGAAIAPATARDLKLATGSLGEVPMHQSISMNGAPATLGNLAPGTFTLCAVAYPREVTEMSAVMEYMNREGDTMKVACSRATVNASPALQRVDLVVDVPAFVPPPPSE